MRLPFLLLLLHATAPVVVLPGQVRLDPLGSFENRGGRFEDCRFSLDGSRMLSRGQLGDLMWWDTTTWTVLRKLPAIAPYLSATALHPTEPWAVVCSTEGGWDGSLAVVDLETGEVRSLGDGYAVDLRFSRDGSQLAALFKRDRNVLELFDTASLRAGRLPEPKRSLELSKRYRNLVFGPGDRYLALAAVAAAGGKSHLRLDLSRGDSDPESLPGAPSAFAPDGAMLPGSGWSRNGVYRARRSTAPSGVERLGPRPWVAALRGRIETWIEGMWVSNAGVIVVSDFQGQLHVIGPAPGEQRIVAGHRGSVTGLAFSPDGQYLASTGEGAATVVDMTGRRLRNFTGTCTLLAAATGSEFYYVTAEGMRTWHAATDRYVGEDVTWDPQLRPEFLTMGVPISPKQFHQRAPVLAHPRGLWFGKSPSRPMSWDFGGEPAPVELARHELAYYGMQVSDLLWDSRRERVLVAEITQGLMCGTGLGHVKYWGSLRAFTAQGEELFTEMLPSGMRWLELEPGGDRVWAGLGDGTLQVLNADSLEQVHSVKPASSTRAFAFLDEARALTLAADGQVYLVDTREPEDWQSVEMPEGFGPVSAMALAPDRETLALASHSDVRLFALRR